jgi:HK97 family phage portal protein
MHLDLVGEAFWVLERDQFGRPCALLPLPPHWVLDVAKPDLPWFVLQVPNGFHGSIAASEVVWFRDPDPLHPYERGTGTALALADEFDADEAARRHIAAFLLNRARPDLIVTGTKDAPFGRDDAARLETAWAERHQGPGKAGRPLFLPGEVQVQEIGHAPKDLEMVQLRSQERDIIVSVFGIPPEKLGILTSSNRASIEAADLFFAKDVLAPRLALIREVIQQRLVPEFDDQFGEDLSVDFVSPIEVDRDFELRVATAAPWL